MEDRDRIPHVSHHCVHFYKIECNNMVKYYQKDKQDLEVIDQVGIRHSRPLFL